LFHGDRYKWSLRFTVINLTSKEALFNFLSTFSGTHFVTPRSERWNWVSTFDRFAHGHPRIPARHRRVGQLDPLVANVHFFGWALGGSMPFRRK
jgi:hypothetical protein